MRMQFVLDVFKVTDAVPGESREREQTRGVSSELLSGKEII
jgi:hypothetical protein